MSEGNGKSKRDVERERFLASAKEQFRVVPVTLPGGSVYHIKTMSAREEGLMGRNARAREEEGGGVDPEFSLASVVQACLCDEDGNLLFTPDDLRTLAAQPSTFLKPIAEASTKLNKLGAQQVEEAEKNSENAPADSSSSDLPVTSEA